MEGGPWDAWADQVLAGNELSRAQALAVLSATDDELPSLLAAAFRVRRTYFGRTVQLYYLRNAKSGLCPEDCGYCSQSKISTADIDKYVFQDERKLLEGARQAQASKARTFCLVASGRGPSNREVTHVANVVRKIKDETGLHICVCLGLLTPENAAELKAAGVDRVNHTLNTSRRYYDEICTTHTFEDRLQTLRNVRQSGMELCSGCIIGMGEEHADLVDVAFTLRELQVESIPVNFLHPIDGTPLAAVRDITPPRLPAGAMPVPADKSPQRAADCRGARAASAHITAAGPVPGQLDLCERLSDDPRPDSRRRLPHDRRPGIRNRTPAGGRLSRHDRLRNRRR